MRSLTRLVTSALVVAWAVVAALVVALLSTVEGAPTEVQLAKLGLGLGLGLGPETVESSTVEAVAASVLVVTLAVHLLLVMLTTRARAALVGAVGGLVGSSLAGAAALVSGVARSGDRADAVAALAQPGAIVVVAVIGVAVGARAWLAHVGRWRYAVVHADDWADQGFD